MTFLKTVLRAAAAYDRFVRVIDVEAVCGESAISDLGLIGILNDWFGDMRGTAAVAAPHLRTDAASAKVENRMPASSAMRTLANAYRNVRFRLIFNISILMRYVMVADLYSRFLSPNFALERPIPAVHPTSSILRCGPAKPSFAAVAKLVEV